MMSQSLSFKRRNQWPLLMSEVKESIVVVIAVPLLRLLCGDVIVSVFALVNDHLVIVTEMTQDYFLELSIVLTCKPILRHTPTSGVSFKLSLDFLVVREFCFVSDHNLGVVTVSDRLLYATCRPSSAVTASSTGNRAFGPAPQITCP
ncbi:hypothetical protein HID58_093803 [Brassica napus]|uniref:Uncharacterized protein n=1 Tax=Brassica napus TaxID=3708 RepID=A0ABQ7X9M1_BRANA|nr:hypothetical protein HID58_093803 [Brassica napus]